jgi:nicotinamidase-related amidase
MTLNAQENESENNKLLKPALLVIDVQNAYLDWMSQEDIEKAFPYINYAIYMFRQKDLPVIRIYHSAPEMGIDENHPGFAFSDSIDITEDDPVIMKTYGNAFNKTGLDKLLRELDCNVLYLCGLSSYGCVLATYFGASDLDYDAFLIKNALISDDAEATRFIEELYNAQSLENIDFLFRYTLK